MLTVSRAVVVGVYLFLMRLHRESDGVILLDERLLILVSCSLFCLDTSYFLLSATGRDCFGFIFVFFVTMVDAVVD